MYKKRNWNCATKQIYGGPQSSHSLVAHLCALSLSLSCALLHVAAAAEWRKKESEREGEYKSTASPPPPHTHTTTLLLPHTHTFSLILYIYSLFCAATAAAAAQPVSCVLANTLCTIASPSWPLVRQLSDVLKSQTRTRNATQRKF